MREARTEFDSAELALDYEEILVVIVSLLMSQEDTSNEGLVSVTNKMGQLVDYLLSVVEESYNDQLYQDMVAAVNHIKGE